MAKAAIIALCAALSGCASLGAPPDDLYWIQRGVTANFAYVSDQDKWGVPHLDESWVTGEHRFTGDCEEYAAAAKYQLEKAGYAAERWVVVDRAGSLHAIACQVGGEWCIDNLHRMPQKRASLGYKWVGTL